MIRDRDAGSRDFGWLLRRLRIDAGLSQEELAESARVSARSVSDLERAVSRTARPETARRLAAALGLAGPEQAGFLAAARGRASRDADRPVATGPVAAAAGATRALPRDVAGFTGRASELEWLLTRLSGAAGHGGVVGICAIGGLAGVGKTALAVHAAHQLAVGYPDGQFFLPLHGHTPGHRPSDPADALADLLLEAGVPAWQIPPRLEPRATRWRAFLAGKKVLLVLDDAAGHEQVEPLLPGTPGCTVLVTSRRRLAALDDAMVISLDILTRHEAAEMLARLAGRPGLEPTDPGVGELTWLCGYLPLAIGMLAGQLRHHPAWTPAGLAADLAVERDRLSLMYTENLSVGAAFSLSYRDLTAGQRRLFRRLGLHPGPDIDAHAAAALSGLSVATARRYLEAIYDQHLIAEPGRGRYRMHDLVREHARALAAADDTAVRDAAVGRLLDYYQQTALSAGQLIGARIVNYLGTLPEGSPPACAPNLTTAGEATMWMLEEEANLRAAAAHAALTGRAREATLIPAAMAEFLFVQGRWRDGIAMHQTAVTAARDAGDPAGQARALGPLIHMQVLTSDFTNARANLHRALRLYRQLGDRAGQSDVLGYLGDIASLTAEYRQALSRYQHALTMCREVGNMRGEANALNGIGAVRFATGDCHAAAAMLEQALSLFRAIGDASGEGEVLVRMALVHIVSGDYEAAAATLNLAMATNTELGNQYLQAWVTIATGMVQRRAGDYQAAAASSQAALDQFGILGLPSGEASALTELGLAQQLAGDFGAAAANHQRALTICTAAADRHSQAEVLNNLGKLSLRRAATAESRNYHAQALALAREIGARLEEARALEGTGRCHLHDGHTTDGTTLLKHALAIYQRAGAAAARDVEETLAALPHTPQHSTEPGDGTSPFDTPADSRRRKK